MSKRGNGEGSVHRLRNGRWRAQLTVGFDPKTGKQRRRYRTATTRREAVAALDELRRRHAQLHLSSAPQTLGEFASVWLSTKASQVKPRTHESYRGTLERHLLPVLGRHRLEDLRTYVIQQHLDHLAVTVSTRTSNYARTVLKALFHQAEKWEMVLRNPVTGTAPKTHRDRPITLWSPSEVRRFLSAARHHRLYALFYLTLLTGLRIGEVMALRWTDLKENAIVVERSVDTRQGKVIESEPKSRSARRIIAIDAGTLAVLAEHRTRQRAELADLGMQPHQQPERMFTSRVGSTLNASNLYKVWRGLQREAGVPEARFHDLRHMHFSMLIMQGVDVKTVADRAGHADPVLTMRQYVHAFDAQRKRAAIPLEALLDDG